MNYKSGSHSAKVAIAIMVVIGAWAVVYASGFGLYEASSKTYAMGGAVLGRAVDASANFHNPATLTDLTNITITAGFMTEHPRGRIKVDGGSSETMNPGVFALPSFQMALPLWYDFVFGLGLMPEYGLGSAYDDNWTLNFNSTETTVTSFTVNPNLAWKIGDLSVAGGLRFLYFDFEQYQKPFAGINGMPMGRMNSRLKGDNDMKDFGYQVGLKYDVTKEFSVGVVYKSLTIVRVKGKSQVSPASYIAHPYSRMVVDASADTVNGPAKTDIELPQSISGGFNWDFAKDWHLGGMVGWTQWSSMKTLDFDLNGYHKDIRLEWNDTWRAGLAPSWDFAEGWTAIMSYVYENDCCGDQESTMLPASDRHMLSWGLCWSPFDSLELALTYGMILMDGKDTQCRESVTDRLYHYRAYRGISHAAGFSVTYRF